MTVEISAGFEISIVSQADGVQGDGLHDLDLVHSNSHSHTAEAIHSQTVGFDDGGSPALSKFTDNNTGATTKTLSVSNIPDSNEVIIMKIDMLYP